MLTCRHWIGQLRRWASTSSRALLTAQNYVELQLDQNDCETPLKYPTVWLRDNCQCEECFHAFTRARKSHWERGPLNAKAESVNYNEESKKLEIQWDDKHKSSFGLDWLKERDFSEATRTKYLQNVYKPLTQLWSKKDFEAVRKEFRYEEILQKDDVLQSWLETLAVQGFAILKDAPNDKNVVRHLANRIGYIKKTTYGDVFEVKSKPNAGNYAYRMVPLPLHTDMPYYEYKAGINILHTLVQSTSVGGANTLTDGFYIADQMRQHYPDYFNILKSIPVNWYDIGHDGDANDPFHSLWRAPVICMDVDNRITRINQNTTKRDSRFSVQLDKVQQWYEAYDKFLELAYAEIVEFKTQAGDVFVFNNLRMLHGRTAYEDSSENKRHLVGAYVDWDIIYSKLRTLKFPNAQD